MGDKHYSKQRELIYQIIRNSNIHPTARIIYEQLSHTIPNISLGTVYRNLNQMTDDGIVIRMPFPIDRYDAETTPHTHFRCLKCSDVFNLDYEYSHALDQLAQHVEPEFRIDGHQIIFEGLCPRCQKSISSEAD